MKTLVPGSRPFGAKPLRSSRHYRLACVPVIILLSVVLAGCGDAEEQAGDDGGTASATPTATTTPSATSDGPSPEDAKAPDNCLSGEKAYVDPDGHFAFCYFAGMEVATVDTNDGVGVTAMDPIGDDNRVVVNVVWTTIARVGWVDIAPCIDSPEIIKNRELRPLTIDGITVEACYQDHYDPVNADVLKYTTIQAEVPADGGVVQYNIAMTGPDFARNGKPSGDSVQRVIDSSATELEVSN